MATTSSIEWTEKTWNPIAGCRRVSPGCGKGASPAGCYAENIAVRFAQSEGKAADRWRLVVRYGDCEKCGGAGAFNGKTCPRCDGKKVVPTGWNGKFVEIPERLVDPLRWREPATVFVNSTSDLFGEGVSDEYIAECFGVMAVAGAMPLVNGVRAGGSAFVFRSRRPPAPNIFGGPHTFQVLTKRADRMARTLTDPRFRAMVAAAARRHALDRRDMDYLCECIRDDRSWPLSNVWIGVSVEDRKHGLPRLDELRKVPAAVRMVSLEPLLEDLGEINLDGIGWAIVGGESGPGARPFALEWAAALSEQCRAAGVPYFFKQAGAAPVDCSPPFPLAHGTRIDVKRIRLADKKGGDVAELARLYPDFAAAGTFRREWPHA